MTLCVQHQPGPAFHQVVQLILDLCCRLVPLVDQHGSWHTHTHTHTHTHEGREPLTHLINIIMMLPTISTTLNNNLKLELCLSFLGCSLYKSHLYPLLPWCCIHVLVARPRMLGASATSWPCHQSLSHLPWVCQHPGGLPSHQSTCWHHARHGWTERTAMHPPTDACEP